MLATILSYRRSPSAYISAASLLSVIWAIVLIFADHDTRITCRYEGPDTAGPRIEYSWRQWSDYTKFLLSMTIISILLAAGSHILSRLRPASKPLSDTATIFLFESSFVFGVLSISNLFMESWTDELFQYALVRGGHHISRRYDIECYVRTSEVYYLTLAALAVMIVFGIFANRTLRASIKESGSSISYVDLFRSVFQIFRNLYHYGHVGVISTSDFVRTRVLASEIVIKVRVRGDSLFREVSLQRDRRTISGFRESVADALNLRSGDQNLESVQFSMIKNGEVIIDRDADIQRLSSGDIVEIALSV
eukprot:TRINITY_DN11949_c0_g1_i1.p1 TRINITY_DN11949_c0_g1~~TRINITY_DN11949_c0_g1_i1.p1  ORF type:complete len:307 (-),score=24.03 TRINITY_DN11949_c0_g1_i1:10-930(-)